MNETNGHEPGETQASDFDPMLAPRPASVGSSPPSGAPTVLEAPPQAPPAEVPPPSIPQPPPEWTLPDQLLAEDYALSRDGDWVRLPKRWSFIRRSLLIFLVVAGLIIVAALLVNNWLQNQLDPPGPAGEEVTVEIPTGASTNDIARILAEEGIVANSTVTRFYFRFRSDEEFQAGEYTFNTNSEVWSVREVLEGGPLPAVFESVTIPEGLWLTDISSRLLDSLSAFDPTELELAVVGGGIRSKFQPEGNISLEGLMFPDTYQVDEDLQADEAAMVARMVAHFDEVATEVGYSQAQALTGLTPYEVIIIASLIEEEAKVPEDRAKISRVIYNRIAQGMKMEIDATVIYALGEHTTELTFADLNFDSPYNTRLNPGLPPTPIAAPGRAALEAALNPADGPWLFYVLADEDGSHFFTDDFDEFQNQVNKSRAEGLF
jgi:UPF0755 protein